MLTPNDDQLNEDGYRDTSKFVSGLIREDQKRRTEERLETLLLEGLDSGEPIELTAETIQQMRGTDRTHPKGSQQWQLNA